MLPSVTAGGGPQADVNPSFDVAVTGLQWAANYSQSRRFLVLTLSRPRCDGLNRLLSVCNNVAVEFKQPALYASRLGIDAKLAEALQAEGIPFAPEAHQLNERASSSQGPFALDKQQSSKEAADRFHISIAWSLAVSGAQELSLLSSENVTQVKDLRVPITTVKAKIGNVINVINLSDSRTVSSKPKWMGLSV